MLVHIVMWNFKSDLSDLDQQEGTKKIKEGLENLSQTIPEIIKIEIGFNAPNAPSENHQICLYAEFESMESLLNYQKHPDHLLMAQTIKQYTQDRICIDYYTNKIN